LALAVLAQVCDADAACATTVRMLASDGCIHTIRMQGGSEWREADSSSTGIDIEPGTHARAESFIPDAQTLANVAIRRAQTARSSRDEAFEGARSSIGAMVVSHCSALMERLTRKCSSSPFPLALAPSSAAGSATASHQHGDSSPASNPDGLHSLDQLQRLIRPSSWLESPPEATHEPSMGTSRGNMSGFDNGIGVSHGSGESTYSWLQRGGPWPQSAERLAKCSA